jgi:HTH-type transcriptional regulator/antitoxin HigA
MLLYHLQRTYLDGASFLDKNNPVIAYTARYNRLDNFWFTVAHEIAHILLHLKNENDCFIDVMSKEYSGDKEKEADELASQKLYSNEILDFFKRDMDYITQSKIKQCSEIYKIHPAIIIGTLAYNKEISFKYLHLFNKDVKSLIPSIYKIEKYICKN